MWLNKTYNCSFNILLQAWPAFDGITTCSARRKTGCGESPANDEIFLQMDRIFCRHAAKKTRSPYSLGQPGKGKGNG